MYPSVSSSSLMTFIGVCVAFLVIIVLIRRKWNFGFSLILGAFIMGLFSLQTISFYDILKGFIKPTFYSFDTHEIVTETIELAFLMTLIFMLAKAMQETGSITRLIQSLRTFFSKGGILAAIPAIYGLMPIPGGALLSAPLIDEEGTKFGLSKNQKNFLNVWFRHIWFPVYPVSFAMILLCSAKFSDIPVYTLILADTPAFFVSIIIGFIVLYYFLRDQKSQHQVSSKDYTGLRFLLPPLLPLAAFMSLQFIGFPKVRSFIIGVLLSIIVLFFLIDITWREYLKVLQKSVTWKLALAIFGIMIFREMFEVSGANVIISQLISMLDIPYLLIIIFIPLVLGFLTGYNLAGVTLSYLFVQPFFSFTGMDIVGLSSLIFMGAFVGYLISPIHLCNVLSSEYLKTDATRMYKTFLPSAFMLLFIHVSVILLLF